LLGKTGQKTEGGTDGNYEGRRECSDTQWDARDGEKPRKNTLHLVVPRGHNRNSGGDLVEGKEKKRYGEAFKKVRA